MKICVIGTGYVGLVTASCLAQTGNHIVGVDIDENKIQMLNRGELPIYEPGLGEILRENLEQGRLQFTTNLEEAVKTSEIIFITVGTPSDMDGSADLKYVMEVAEGIGKAMNGYKVIIDKSTVPVYTAEKVAATVAQHTNHRFDVVSNPEFLKEGYAVEDFMKPDRVVIGCDSPQAQAVIGDLYSPFVRSGHPVLFMGVESAELTKYTANALLAAKISFINEIARLCEKVGADVVEVRSGIGSDSRIGNAFLFPGMGFGGSCFPKDLRALDYTATEKGLELLVVKAAIRTNELQKQFIPRKIAEHFGETLRGRRIAVWGLAFKANTDDIRESPAIPLLEYLLKAGAEVCAYDPQAMEQTQRRFGDKLSYTEDNFSALKDADALVIATEWNEFRRPDFERMKELMKQPVIFDGRNLFEPKNMVKMGFTYYGVGRAS